MHFFSIRYRSLQRFTGQRFPGAFLLLVMWLAPSCLMAAERVHTLANGETISFYTRVAPDLSAIGFTRTKPGSFSYAPVILDLKSYEVTSLQDIRYDPTFSPDYNLELKTGLVFGARGGASTHAKHMAFYLPGQFDRPKQEFYFDNISGYATVAHLADANTLPLALKPFAGHYLVMGKRWRWFIVEAVKDSEGGVIDYKRIYPPQGTLAAAPLCSNLNVDFDKSDSMLSANARYISAKRRDRNKVPVIVRLQDCSIVPTPALDGLYGGKASFSNDERFMAFHAFGEDGRFRVVDQMTNNGLIKKWADAGLIANVFLYDIELGKLTQLTFNDERNSAIDFFPNFSGDGKWIYFHQHKKNAPASEILRIPTLSPTLHAYKTSFFIGAKDSRLTWRELVRHPSLLNSSVSALTGAAFTTRPPEWEDYFDHPEFEDERLACLEDPESWQLISGRIEPFEGHVKLTFQPFCELSQPSTASDSSLQVVFHSSERSAEKSLLKIVSQLSHPRAFTEPFSSRFSLSLKKASLDDAGFTSFAEMEKMVDMPQVIFESKVSWLIGEFSRLMSHGFEIHSVQ